MVNYYFIEYNGANTVETTINTLMLCTTDSPDPYPERYKYPLCTCFPELGDQCYYPTRNFSYWKHIGLKWSGLEAENKTIDIIRVGLLDPYVVGRRDPIGGYGILIEDYDQARGDESYSGYRIDSTIPGHAHSFFVTSGTVELLKNTTIELDVTNYYSDLQQSYLLVLQMPVGYLGISRYEMRSRDPIKFEITYTDNSSETISLPVKYISNPKQDYYIPKPLSKEDIRIYYNENNHWAYKTIDSTSNIPIIGQTLNPDELSAINAVFGTELTIPTTLNSYLYFLIDIGVVDKVRFSYRVKITGGDCYFMYKDTLGNWVERETITATSYTYYWNTIHLEEMVGNTLEVAFKISSNVANTLFVDLFSTYVDCWYANILSLESTIAVPAGTLTAVDRHYDTIEPIFTGSPSTPISMVRICTLGIYDANINTIPPIPKDWMTDSPDSTTYQIRGDEYYISLPSVPAGKRIYFLINCWSVEDLPTGNFDIKLKYPYGYKLTGNLGTENNPRWYEIYDVAITSQDAYWSREYPGPRHGLTHITPRLPRKKRYICLKWRP